VAPWLLVCALCGYLFFYRLGDRGLGSSHEARAAQNAHSILAEGDWTLPQLFDRRVELQKPPLYYWLAAVLALVGGRVGAFTVRLPAALAGLATVLALYLLCARRGRPLAGFVAAAVLATCWHFTWLARVARIDMPLTLTVTVAVLGFYLGRCRLRERAGQGSWWWLLLAYLAVAAGLLLKGPIALVLAAAVALTFLAGEAVVQRLDANAAGPLPPAAWWLRWVHDFGVWWGVPLVLLLAGPWYLLANLQTNGDFFRVFFWHHNIERGFGTEGELRSHPWWLYGPRLFGDLLPWSLVLPFAVWGFVRRGLWCADPLARLGLAWLGSLVLLLSCMSFKRADYLLPAYPGAALLLGCVAERCWQARRSAYLGWAFLLILAGYTAAWGLSVTVVLPGQEAARPAQHFAAAIRARTTLPVIFFRTEDHELAFHVGRPIETLVEWENLDEWLAHPGPVYVVMPTDCAAECAQRLKHGHLEEVVRNTDLAAGPVERPLVLLRARIFYVSIANSLLAAAHRCGPVSARVY
jgi:4-amino-4-deoxy-L-arabinose transferase-like glycosyltransferase